MGLVVRQFILFLFVLASLQWGLEKKASASPLALTPLAPACAAANLGCIAVAAMALGAVLLGYSEIDDVVSFYSPEDDVSELRKQLGANSKIDSFEDDGYGWQLRLSIYPMVRGADIPLGDYIHNHGFMEMGNPVYMSSSPMIIGQCLLRKELLNRSGVEIRYVTSMAKILALVPNPVFVPAEFDKSQLFVAMDIRCVSNRPTEEGVGESDFVRR